MKQILIIKLVVWLGWLSYIALAQLELSGAITDSVSFPDAGITCLGNFAAFITSLIRRRFYLEMGVKEFMASATMEKPLECQGEGEFIVLSTTDTYKYAHVVMLSSSTGMSNITYIKKFMKYKSDAHDVDSILLKCDFLRKNARVAQDIPRECNYQSAPGNEKHSCNCIVFRSEDEDMTVFLARHMKELHISDSQWLLMPSAQCQKNHCHGCNQDLVLSVLETQNESGTESSAVCDALDFKFTTITQKEPICICIPVKTVPEDRWTKLLVRTLKSKDQQDNGAIVMASDALQSYLDGKREDRAEQVTYRTLSLLLPRLVEISINLVLTLVFKVDGFSSSLAARRAVRSYVVDSGGNGLPADVFLTSALVVVKSDTVCQVLKFRGTFLSSRALLFMVCCVNLICFITWSLLISFSGGAGKWYKIPSMEPSKPRVVVIIAAIGIGIVMDCFQFSKITTRQRKFMLSAVIVIEVAFAVVAGVFGLKKDIGRWVYGALQFLVWLKWGFGSYLLRLYSPEYVPTVAKYSEGGDGIVELENSSDTWIEEGTLVYSSSFFLNAALAGVRGNWAGVWSKWKQSG